MDKVVKVLLFVFMGAIFVLIITHASGFSSAVTAVGGQVSNIGSGLSGTGFGNGTAAPSSSTTTTKKAA